MNIGGAGTTILMIFAGLAGSGVLLLFVEGKLGNQDEAILTSFIPPIAFFYCNIKYRSNMRRYCLYNGLQIESISISTAAGFILAISAFVCMNINIIGRRTRNT
jgi:hypothetical protein